MMTGILEHVKEKTGSSNVNMHHKSTCYEVHART